MDQKSSNSSSECESTTASSNSNSNSKDQYLKQLNTLSHKISKPNVIKKVPSFKESTLHQKQAIETQHHPNNPQQPPVYNIKKNNFREVVQKLTGSTAHERVNVSNSTAATPTATSQLHQKQQQQQILQTATKPQSSRLQRIRPPPLAQISNLPSPLLNCAAPQVPGFGRPAPPFSPLPPFPGVDAAAESPVTAYLRNFMSSTAAAVDSSNPKEFSGFAPMVVPRWSNLIGSQSQPHMGQVVHPLQGITASAASASLPSAGTVGSLSEFQFPPSPLPFGCLNSPSGQLGFSQLPLSPTVPVPVPSPK